jgi:hypothetical protein
MSLFNIDQVKLDKIKEEKIMQLRNNAYTTEADPLFFKAQRGEATLQEWRDKILEIKNRFPK